MTTNDAAVRERDEANARLHDFQDGIPNLAWIATPDGKIEYVNRRWMDYTGLSAAELLGDKWLQVLHPDDLERHLKKWSHAMAHGVAYEEELRIRRQDGVYRWHFAKDWPEFDAQGKPIRWYGTMSDVDDYHRLTEELRRSEHRLMEANRELDLFASIAAHDLKEPLRMVISFLFLLERRLQDRLDPQENAYFNQAVSGARRMNEMIDSLLRLARVSHDPLDQQRFDVMSALAQALENLRTRITETQTEVTHDIEAEIIADRGQIVRLFQNLINNAIKFVAPGIRPKIHVSATLDDSRRLCIVKVSDNGIGIDQDAIDRIFQAFCRAVDRGQYPGTGLGLAICKRIVERHGGTIRAESNPGSGSTFLVTISAAPMPQ